MNCLASGRSLSFANDTCLNSRVRGVYDLRDKRVTELRNAGNVVVHHIKGEFNPSDLLTKCMASGPYNRLVRAILNGGRFSCHHSDQGGV